MANAGDRAITVRTNAFRITQLPRIKYHQYDVINPELRNVRRRKELILAMQETAYPQIFQPRCIYDTKAILFSPTRLRLPGGTLEVSLGNGPRDRYQVTLTHTGEIDFQGLNQFIQTGAGAVTPDVKVALNLLQMILRQAASLMFPTKGRSVFTGRDRPYELGSGVQMLSGFFQSVRPIRGSAIVNVDVANSAFYKPGNLSSLAMDVLSSSIRNANARMLQKTMNDQDGPIIISTLKNFFHKVLFKVPKVSGDRIRTFRGIKENAGLYRFSKRTVYDGQEMETDITVEDYYLEVYQIRLRSPRDFGVIISPPGQPLQVIPFELCEVIPGQPFKRKLDDGQTRKMVENATSRPNARLERIQAAIAHTGSLQYGNSDFIATAGLRVEPRALEIQGTSLAPPPVQYGGGQRLSVSQGCWNMLGKTVREPGRLHGKWMVLNFSGLDQSRVVTFVRALHDCCVKIGRDWQVLALMMFYAFSSGTDMPPLDLSLYAQVNSQRDDLTSVIRRMSPSGPPAFILAILRKSDADTKAKLKQFADLAQFQYPVITQCVREDKFASNLTPQNGRRLNQYCNNVALKINARLGGVNHAVELPVIQGRPFMIIGLDVSHPPGGPRLDRPSVASLVFSTDRYGCRYQARYSVLRPRTEALDQDLGPMVESAIDTYVNMHGPPAYIVCYRDGLSEDELQRTAASEMQILLDTVNQRIRQLAQKLGKPVPPSPKLTFIVVTKRHHFTAFPMNEQDADRSGNLSAGFATDESTSTPGLSEFYLLSHSGLLGTSRPSHYIVLRDEIFNFDLRAIQRLSFALCHVYAKATRSVSIPAPVYYADLACLRATTYYFEESLRFGGDDSTDGGVRSNRQLREEFDLARWQQGFRHPSGSTRSVMYFL